MAQGRRVERVAALIRKEVSELMINGIRDERVHQGMVSITEVEVSGDLQHCKIFVSVFGEAQERDQVLEGLRPPAASCGENWGGGCRCDAPPKWCSSWIGVWNAAPPFWDC